MSYTYVSDEVFIRDMKRLCSNIMNQLKQTINNEDVMIVRVELIGSGARDLITQNGNNSVDLDYNLIIESILDDNLDIDDCRSIKEYVIEVFNDVLNKNGWSNCKDSTSSLATEYRYFTSGNQTSFKIDLGIIKKDQYGVHRLIHHKTGFVQSDQYYWNIAPNSTRISQKSYLIKNYGYWEELRECYLRKKNGYLREGPYNYHPSYNCYIEAINEIYNSHFE